METKIQNKGVHMPAARGRISVPTRGQFVVQNIATSTPAVKPTVTALPSAKPEVKLDENRVTFDTMMNKPVQQTPVMAPVETPPLQTAVAVAAQQPETALQVPMNASVDSSMTVPMVQVAPMNEVALVPEKKQNVITSGFKESITRLKDGVKKINVKDLNPANYKIDIKIGDVVRYGVVAVILIISGYLAYDTWTTNQQAKDIFSQSAAAFNEGDNGNGSGNGAGGTNSGNSSNSNDSDSQPDYAVAPNMPKYISIPKIGVNNARIEKVGLQNNSKVGTPKNLNNVAWYTGSVKPGEKGAMFMNAHINDVGAGGIFNNLKNVSVGDKVVVERGDGTKFNYKVVHTETLPTSSVSMSKAMSVRNKKEEGVNLMTCAGTYNFSTRSYSHRVIVYAVRV